MRTLGVDVSHHQGAIDWAALGRFRYGDRSPRFAIHKATEGATYQDRRYAHNRSEARRHGLTWGAYHIIRLDTPEDMDAEAANFVEAAKLGDGDIPPVCDIETQWIDAAPGPAAAVQGIRIWCDIVKADLGVDPILYLSPRGLRHLGDHASGLAGYRLWICDYDDDPTDEMPEGFREWVLWQFTSKGDGAAAGVSSTYIDLDWFNGSEIELLRLADWSRATPAPIDPSADPVLAFAEWLFADRRVARKLVDRYESE